MDKEIIPTHNLTLGEYWSIREKLIKGLTFYKSSKEHERINKYSLELVDFLLPKMYDVINDWRSLQKYVQLYIDDCKDSKRSNIVTKCEYRKKMPNQKGRFANKGISIKDLEKIFGLQNRLGKQHVLFGG